MLFNAEGEMWPDGAINLDEVLTSANFRLS